MAGKSAPGHGISAGFPVIVSGHTIGDRSSEDAKHYIMNTNMAAGSTATLEEQPVLKVRLMQCTDRATSTSVDA